MDLHLLVLHLLRTINLPATVRIRNVRTWHPDRTLSYLLKIMFTLFQNREQNSVGCHAQFVHPTFVWRFMANRLFQICGENTSASGD